MMGKRSPEEGAQILRDVEEIRRALERDYPHGPYGVRTPESGWIMSEPGEGERAFLQRIRGEDDG